MRWASPAMYRAVSSFCTVASSRRKGRPTSSLAPPDQSGSDNSPAGETPQLFVHHNEETPMKASRLRAWLFTGAAAVGLVSLSAKADDKKWTEVRIVTEGGFVPWNYTKPDGTVAGFEIDLIHNLCDRMQVKCTIATQSFDSMIPALTSGKYDAIVDDVAITPKREEVIAFSAPYAALCYTFATLKDSDIAGKLPRDDRIVPLGDEAAAAKALEPVKAALKDKSIGTLSAGTSVAFFCRYLSQGSDVDA